MSKLIRAADARKAILKADPKLAYCIDNVKAVDAVEVVHGRWNAIDECANSGVYCSVCHRKIYKECYGNCKLKSNYCPNCGAYMRDGDADA